MSSFSAIIPCCNEEDYVNAIYTRLCEVLEPEGELEIIYIDDGSTDSTLELVKSLSDKDPRVKYLSFTKNFGLEPAMRAGFKYASKRWVIQIDADLQSPPEKIPEMIRKAEEGYDAVFAIRRGRKDGILKIWGSMTQHFISKHFFKIDMPRNASTFRIFDSRVAKKIVHYKASAYPYFMPEAVETGLKYSFVEVPHLPREHGESKFKLWYSLISTKDLFLGHSLVPLNYFLLLAVLSIGLLFSSTEWVIGGFASLFAFGFWLLAIYTGRCVKELSFKNDYFVREANVKLDPKDDYYEFDRSPAWQNQD